jgi:hypothetical protein
VPFAAQTDHRIKAVATVSAVEIGDLFSRGLGRTQGADALDAVLTTAGQLRTAEAKGAEPTYETYVPSSPDGLEEAPSLSRGLRLLPDPARPAPALGEQVAGSSSTAGHTSVSTTSTSTSRRPSPSSRTSSATTSRPEARAEPSPERADYRLQAPDAVVAGNARFARGQAVPVSALAVEPGRPGLRAVRFGAACGSVLDGVEGSGGVGLRCPEQAVPVAGGFSGAGEDFERLADGRVAHECCDMERTEHFAANAAVPGVALVDGDVLACRAGVEPSWSHDRVGRATEAHETF